MPVVDKAISGHANMYCRSCTRNDGELQYLIAPVVSRLMINGFQEILTEPECNETAPLTLTLPR